MPPKSAIPPLKPERVREIMKEFKIEFVGPQPDSEWPLQYKALFKKIRDIGRYYFEDDGKDGSRAEDTPLSIPAKMLNRRALILKRSVVIPGDDPVNEATLRGKTEHLVFSRFAAEVKCNTCHLHIWLSEFQVLPSDPAKAEDLEKRRARRKLCQCSPDQWTSDGFDDKGVTLLFGSFWEETVFYDRSERLKERGVTERQPDLVFALKATESVAHFKADFDARHSEPQLRHSPFKKSGLLYPFLIVESKSEENGPGFEAIQRQTAFPIRTCLKLQQELQRASGQPLEPLVWYFAYQADEWRVSACVVNDGKYQIFDLWLNRVLDISGALQLLRIVDCIADWARDIYRFEILSCLAGGSDRLLQHRGNSIDTYADRRSVQPSHSRSNVLHDAGSVDNGPGTQSSAEDPNEDDIPMEDLMPISYDKDTAKREKPASHPFLRWLEPDTVQQDTSAGELTIRHSNMVLFNFIHLHIPENVRELAELLGRVSRSKGRSVGEVADALWLSISSRATSVATTVSQLDQIKVDWLKLTPTVVMSEGIKVRSIFKFRTFMRSSDWQVVREMACISCSYQAAQRLASLAGVRSVVSTEWAAETDDFPWPTFRALRSLTGRLSAAAAFTSQTTYLMRSGDFPLKYCWVLGSDVDIQTKSSFTMLTENPRSNFATMMDTGNKKMAVIPKRTPNEIRRLFLTSRASPFVSASAVLLRRERHETTGVATWCLMVFEEVDFMNDKAVGRILADSKANGQVMTLTRRDRADEMNAVSEVRLDPSAKISCMDWWIEKLMS